MGIFKSETCWEGERRYETSEQKRDRLFRNMGAISALIIFVGLAVLKITGSPGEQDKDVPQEKPLPDTELTIQPDTTQSNANADTATFSPITNKLPE